LSTSAGSPEAAPAVAVGGPTFPSRVRSALADAGGFCSRHPALTVSVVATLWALGLTFGLVRHLDADIYGQPGDPTGTIAVYAWWGHALTHGKSLFDFPWGAPLGAGFEHVPYTALQLGVSAPMSAVLGPMVTYNLEILSGFTLTAWVTFLLGRQLGLPSLAAAFSALALTFMPYHVEKAMGHLGMVHMELFSGTLLFLVRWRATGRRRNLVWAGIVAGLALCLDPYDAFIALVMTAAFVLVSVLTPSPLLPGIVRRLRAHAVAAVIVALAAGLLVPPALLAAYRPSSSEGYQQGVTAAAGQVSHSMSELFIFSARTKEYLLPWHANPLVPQAVKQFEVDNLHHSNLTENTLFLGYTVILLAITGVVASLRRSVFPVVLCLAVGLGGYVFAEPPFVHQVLPGISWSTPSYYIFPVLPYFRVYARFAVLVMLAAALLGGVGLAALATRLPAGRARTLLVVPFLLLAIEFNNLPPTHTTRLYPAPPEYTWLASQPAGILIEYPLHAGDPGAQERKDRQYVLYQQTHQHPIFNGATPESRAGQLEPQLEPYYAPQVVSQLRGLGIRYVFVHLADYAADGLQLPRQVDGLSFVTTMGGVDVFEVSGA
jgi:hypothetical protein